MSATFFIQRLQTFFFIFSAFFTFFFFNFHLNVYYIYVVFCCKIRRVRKKTALRVSTKLLWCSFYIISSYLFAVFLWSFTAVAWPSMTQWWRIYSLRATADTAKRVWAVVILSVCLSVCPSWPGTDSSPGEIDSGFSSYDSLEFLVSKFHAAGWRDSLEIPLRNRCVTIISSSSVRTDWTVADRHRLAAYHNSTADELSRDANIDDLERPPTPKYGF